MSWRTRLERAFITPFDREDIHELASRLDDVVDGIQEVAETFVIYGIDAAHRGVEGAWRRSCSLARRCTCSRRCVQSWSRSRAWSRT